MSYFCHIYYCTKKKEENQKELSKRLLTYGFWHSFGTVSYTHLDVYKRQLTDNANKCMDIMKDMNTTSKTQIDTLTVTQDTFQELKNALDVCIETVQDIAAKMQEIDQQKDYVVGHIETLNALSANNASFTEETSATSEEIDNAVKDSMEVLDTVMNLSLIHI